jgi:hypothetical protein
MAHKFKGALLAGMACLLLVGCGKDPNDPHDPENIKKVADKRMADYERETWIARGKVSDAQKLLQTVWPSLEENRISMDWLVEAGKKEGIPPLVSKQIQASRALLYKSGTDTLTQLDNRIKDAQESYQQSQRLSREVRPPPEALREIETALAFLEERCKTYQKNWDSYYKNGTELKKLD